MALRVPTIDVSVVDLTVELEKEQLHFLATAASLADILHWVLGRCLPRYLGDLQCCEIAGFGASMGGLDVRMSKNLAFVQVLFQRLPFWIIGVPWTHLP